MADFLGPLEMKISKETKNYSVSYAYSLTVYMYCEQLWNSYIYG